MSLTLFFLAVTVGYFLGSIPFGLVLTRISGYGDIRKIGSGNIGATNVLRTGSKLLAVATILLDVFKGTLAVLCFYPFSYMPALVSGFCAFLGHLFPIWLKFQGGKGVATFLGVSLAILWPSSIFFILVWLCVVLVTRYSSLAGLISCLSTTILFLILGLSETFFVFALMTILVFIRHKSNINRLFQGEEKKIFLKYDEI